MGKYKVTGTTDINGKIYETGDTVELTEEEARGHGGLVLEDAASNVVELSEEDMKKHGWTKEAIEKVRKERELAKRGKPASKEAAHDTKDAAHGTKDVVNPPNKAVWPGQTKTK